VGVAVYGKYAAPRRFPIERQGVDNLGIETTEEGGESRRLLVESSLGEDDAGKPRPASSGIMVGM
jgi:hypothetical protein